MVVLLDLRARGQSDVTSVERGGVFGDLRLSRFLQSGKEESQGGWCVVSSFLSLSLSLSLSHLEFWSAECRLPSFDLASLSRNLSFISFFSSDRTKLGFLCFLPWRARVSRKFSFTYFDFLTNFIDILLCADPMSRNPFFSILKKVSAPIASGECSRGR